MTADATVAPAAALSCPPAPLKSLDAGCVFLITIHTPLFPLPFLFLFLYNSELNCVEQGSGLIQAIIPS